MDDIVARPRYSRRSAPVKRKKRSARETDTYFEKFVRQVVFALIILVLIGIVKSVDTPVTDFLSEKVKYIVAKDIQIKEIYSKLNGVMDNFLKDDEKTTERKDNTDGNTGMSNAASLSDDDESNMADAVDNDAVTQDNDLTQDEETEEIIASIKDKHSFLTPVEGSVTSAFGQRTHPVWKTEVFHSGVDIEAVKGVPIKAALEGVVIEASTSVTYGKYVKMEHADGIVTLYGHCSQLSVKKGQKVDKGETIAKVGNTGVSVGTHLHFEVWKDGKPLDPLNFIKVSD